MNEMLNDSPSPAPKGYPVWWDRMWLGFLGVTLGLLLTSGVLLSLAVLRWSWDLAFG